MWLDLFRSQTPLDLKEARRPNGGAHMLPLDKPLRKPHAGSDIELVTIGLGNFFYLPTATAATLDAEDAIFFGKLGGTFLVDEAMGQEDRPIGKGDLAEGFTVDLVPLGDETGIYPLTSHQSAPGRPAQERKKPQLPYHLPDFAYHIDCMNGS